MKVIYHDGSFEIVCQVVFAFKFNRSMIGLIKKNGWEPVYQCVEEVARIESAN